MRQLVKLLLITLLIGLLPSGSFAQKSGRRTRKTSPQIICEIASVPKGSVVVGYKRNSACKSGAELLVKRPEDGDIICAGSPVPPQFSIATEAQGPFVGTCRDRAFLIVATQAAATEWRPQVERHPTTEPRTATKPRGARSVGDETIGRAFATGATGTQVTGEGTVIRLLSDDLNGSRHQRFIVELSSGQTLLITHNIDLAPRLDGLAVGDSVRFSGEYAWNEKGGVVHWTHRDPRGKHVAGWLMHNGHTYQD